MSYGTITDDTHHGTSDLEPGPSGASHRRPSVTQAEKLKMTNANHSHIAGHDSPEDVVSDFDDQASQYSAQAGVKRLEAISSTWSRWGLWAAYFGVCLLAYATSLEGQTTANLTIYATSAFKAHSLIATVLVVNGVVLSVVKPPMSKIADVFGRFEAFTLSVVIFTIGYVQQAASDSVETYAVAQVFYAAGSTGVQILIQIFIADTSDLVNRALCSTLPALPFLVNVWIGSPLADLIISKASWRWGYGMWAIILPLAYLPLALALYVNQRRAAMKGLLPPSPFSGLSYWGMAKHMWFELDVFGLLLLCAAFSLLLIPLTLAAENGWDSPNLISMLLVGAACLAVFPFWEKNKTLAPKAFFPMSLFRNRTVLAGFGISFFYFMTYYLSVYPYFQSYLLVVHGQSITTAGRIVQMWTFAATISSFFVSMIIKYTKHYKFYVTLGACINLLGLLSMVFYRTEGASTATLVATTALVGIGGGMLNAPAQLGVQASVRHQEVAAATAIFLTFLEIGGAVGSGISGAIWTANVPHKLALYLPEETKGRAAEIFASIGLAAMEWPMGDPTRVAINRAYQETMTRILMVGVAMAIPVVALSFLMKNYKLDEMDSHVRGVVIGGGSGGGTERSPSVVAAAGQYEPVFSGSRESFDGRRAASMEGRRSEEAPMLRRAESQRLRRLSGTRFKGV